LEEIVKPAVEGTLNVLRSCANARTVKKVVITSSGAAIHPEGQSTKIWTENDWNDAVSIERNPYHFSKVMAEKGAWEFQEKLSSDEKFNLVTICPTTVLGPQLSADSMSITTSLIRSLMQGEYPGLPRLRFNLVDVRDVATAHTWAMESEKANGRYIVTNTGLWLQEMALILTGAFPNSPIPTKILPDVLVFAFALFDPRTSFHWLKANLGTSLELSNSKLLTQSKMSLIPIEQTIVDTATSQIELGVISKKRNSSMKKLLLTGILIAGLTVLVASLYNSYT